MRRHLSCKADLEGVAKEARNLLHGLQRRDRAAVERYYCQDPLAGTFEPTLADAQYAIAREYGYSSWQKLKESLETAKPKALS